MKTTSMPSSSSAWPASWMGSRRWWRASGGASPGPRNNGRVRQPDLALVTATRMPKPDPESGLLVTALAQLGLDAEIRVWDRPCDWSAFGLVVSRTPWDYFH